MLLSQYKQLDGAKDKIWSALPTSRFVALRTVITYLLTGWAPDPNRKIRAEYLNPRKGFLLFGAGAAEFYVERERLNSRFNELATEGRLQFAQRRPTELSERHLLRRTLKEAELEPIPIKYFASAPAKSHPWFDEETNSIWLKPQGPPGIIPIDKSRVKEDALRDVYLFTDDLPKAVDRNNRKLQAAVNSDELATLHSGNRDYYSPPIGRRAKTKSNDLLDINGRKNSNNDAIRWDICYEIADEVFRQWQASNKDEIRNQSQFVAIVRTRLYEKLALKETDPRIPTHNQAHLLIGEFYKMKLVEW